MGGLSIKCVKVINLNPFLMSILKKDEFYLDLGGTIESHNTNIKTATLCLWSN